VPESRFCRMPPRRDRSLAYDLRADGLLSGFGLGHFRGYEQK
jgi:hypothetical protein